MKCKTLCRGIWMPKHAERHFLAFQKCGGLSTSSPSFSTDLGVCRAVALLHPPLTLLWPQLPDITAQ